MASSVCSEKWVCINRNEEFQGIQVSEINGANFLITSLMEELQDHQVEESDEERLNSIIQSLEAEIKSSGVDFDQDSYMEYHGHDQYISDGENSDRSCSLEQMDGQDCSITFGDLDMNCWIDMEAVPCSPSHDLDWYTYPCGDEMISRFALDDQENGCYISNLYWQETSFSSMMYN